MSVTLEVVLSYDPLGHYSSGLGVSSVYSWYVVPGS